jgi:hypothetical protein
MRREEIGDAVQFTNGDEHPVFWGYFPAHDDRLRRKGKHGTSWVSTVQHQT